MFNVLCLLGLGKEEDRVWFAAVLSTAGDCMPCPLVMTLTAPTHLPKLPSSWPFIGDTHLNTYH